MDGAELSLEALRRRFRAHPWHGIPLGPEAPAIVTCYIEIVPTDTVKFELDKNTGHLRVDRPQRFSNVCPSLYGLLPQTYAGPRVAEFCAEATGRPEIAGDGDPLDICILSERAFSHGDIILEAVPIGGLRMLDGDEADDKIVGVLVGDPSYGDWRDISECPHHVIERLRHYFLTYKNQPEETPKTCEITHVYDAADAHEVIRRSMADYQELYGD